MSADKKGTKKKDKPKYGDQKQENNNHQSISKDDNNPSIDEKIIEKNKYIFELVNMWISNADNKINIAFAMLSVLVAVFVFIADNLLSDMIINQNANKSYLNEFYIFAIIALVVFGFSIYCYIKAIIPRLTSDKSFMKLNKKDNNATNNPKYSIFYDEIKDFEKPDGYVKCAQTANNSMFNKELLKEIYYNSGICSKKMFWFDVGASTMFGAIILAMGAALFYFLYAIGF